MHWTQGAAMDISGQAFGCDVCNANLLLKQQPSLRGHTQPFLGISYQALARYMPIHAQQNVTNATWSSSKADGPCLFRVFQAAWDVGRQLDLARALLSWCLSDNFDPGLEVSMPDALQVIHKQSLHSVLTQHVH